MICQWNTLRSYETPNQGDFEGGRDGYEEVRTQRHVRTQVGTESGHTREDKCHPLGLIETVNHNRVLLRPFKMR